MLILQAFSCCAHILLMVGVLPRGWKRGQPHWVRLTPNQAAILNALEFKPGYNRLSHSEMAALSAIAGLDRDKVKAVKGRYVKSRARLELERLALLSSPTVLPEPAE